MAAGEHDSTASERCSLLSKTPTIRPSKMKRVTITDAPAVQLACEESVHYPVFNPKDPRHNPFVESKSWTSDDYRQHEKLDTDSTACWKRSLPMRSLRKARSGFLALKSGMKRRSCILTSNNASESSPVLAELPTYEKGPSFPSSLSEASTAEDREFGTRLHRIRCQHPPPCRTENCPGKAWMPKGDLASLRERRGTAWAARPSRFPAPVPKKAEPATKENMPIMKAVDGRPTVLASQPENLLPAPSPITLLGSTVAINPLSCSPSVESVNSQYPGPIRLRPIRGRFYGSIDPRLISTEHSEDHGLTDWSDTSTSLPSTFQAKSVLQVSSGVNNGVSVPASPSSDRVHHTNAMPHPRGGSPIRRLIGIEKHVSNPLSDRLDSMAHKIRPGTLKIPSDLPKSRSSLASDRASSVSKQRSSKGSDSLRLSLRLPSMILRIDFHSILSWGRTEARDPS